MKIQIHFLEGLRTFTAAQKTSIKKAIKTASAEVDKELEINHPIVFTVVVSGTFHDGYTASADWIRLAIPEKKFSVRELTAAVFHELNHIARGYSESQNIKNNINLLDVIVAEGLGTYYEMQKVKDIPFPHGEYELKELKKYFKTLKANIDNTHYNYFEWFFGTKKLPYQFGYKMGKYVIDKVFEHNPKITLAQLTKMPTARIWKLSKISLG